MTECQNCGAYVSPTFARVFGTNENDVFACPDCTTFADLYRGGAADL
jgi:hypothetical protein